MIVLIGLAALFALVPLADADHESCGENAPVDVCSHFDGFHNCFYVFVNGEQFGERICLD